MIVLVSGVAGSGKSTVGAALAARLGWDLIEGDDLHPAENREKMSGGRPLTDEDRRTWLSALGDEIDRRLRDGRSAVVTSSALKRRYRDRLRVDDPRVLLVFLDISPRLARQRLATRAGHFFGPDLVESQFRALEPPEHLVLPGDAPVEDLVASILDQLPSPPESDPRAAADVP